MSTPTFRSFASGASVAGFREVISILNHKQEAVTAHPAARGSQRFRRPVRGQGRAWPRSGTYQARVDRGELVLGYRRETYVRETRISSSVPAAVDDHGLTFELTIEPHGSWETELSVTATAPGFDTGVKPGRAREAGPKPRQDMARGLDKWLAKAPRLECDNDGLRATYPRSLVDLAALRFSPQTMAHRSLPAAGLPWFMTIFGRDSILTSLQSIAFTPELAATTLRVLGERQGTRIDDFRDEDPGRILHEMRFGELTAFEERPHSPYYGCADATPLYVVLLDEYERWTGDTKLVRDLEYEARAALRWIDEYADLQGNGYIAYQRRNEETGLENQCWKDSWDSISYRDGTLPGFPRATCELQGYAYDAKVRGARLARHVWHDERLRRPAREGGGRSQAPVQPRLLGGRRRILRRRPRRRRPSGGFPDLQQRPSAVERHRRQEQGHVGWWTT